MFLKNTKTKFNNYPTPIKIQYKILNNKIDNYLKLIIY